jgi:hypothetical protein
LNMAEIELNVLTRYCLNWRIDHMEIVRNGGSSGAKIMDWWAMSSYPCTY